MCLVLYLFYLFNGHKKCNNSLIIIFFAILLAGHSFVEPLSLPDLPSYLELYNEVYNVKSSLESLILLNLTYSMELGYVFFNKLCSHISQDFGFFLLIVNFILLVSYFKIIVNYSPYIYLSIILFVLTTYGQSYFVLRQHLAVGVILLTYPAIINRELKKFIIFSFIAFLLHKSSLIWFPIYFIYGIKNNKKLIISLICSAIFLSLVFSKLSIITDYLKIGYGTYIDGEKEGAANFTEFFLAIIFLSTSIFFQRRMILHKGINKLVFIAFSINTIMSLVGVNLGILTRLKLYYFISIIFIIPLTVKYINTKILRFFYIFTIISILTIQTFWGSNAANFENMKLDDPSLVNLVFYIIMIFIFMGMTKYFKFKVK